jgi:hypothetical protein
VFLLPNQANIFVKFLLTHSLSKFTFLIKLVSIVLTFTTATNDEEITFANQTFTLQKNTLEYRIEVYNWPFISISNSLEIWASIEAVTVCCSLTSTQTNKLIYFFKNQGKQLPIEFS